MERRKIPKVEQLGQVLNTKNRLNSCLGVCFLTSILTFYFILPADIAGARTKSISIFSWFSSSPGSDGGVWNVPVGGHSMDRGRRKGGGDLEEKNTTTITTTFGTNVTTKITPVVPPEKPSVNVTMLVQPENSSANVTKKTTTLVRPEMGGVSENPEANVTTKITHLVQPEKVPKEVPKCDIFDGRWVKDERIKPYYSHRSCPYMDIDFNCHKNGRPDHEFLKWRWQPYGCTIPILNATDFLERMRGKRLIFVGDSLNRNMWESLVCILRQSIPNKKNVYEISGRMQFKTAGYYGFKFKDYDCSIDFVRSTFLVRNVYVGDGKDDSNERLRLDLLDDTTRAYRKADVIVFNTGHWWTHEKTSKGVNYYQEGNHVHPFLDVSEAYERALTTWARWIDRNIDSKKTQLFFRGYSPTHFRGGQWNSGGKCHKEIDPIRNDTYLDKYPSKMTILDKVLKRMKTPVVNLNITRLSDYRKDGHPSIYRKRYDSVEQQVAAEASQDCSHWCLPGLPDTWNQLLYASLLVNAKGS